MLRATKHIRPQFLTTHLGILRSLVRACLYHWQRSQRCRFNIYLMPIIWCLSFALSYTFWTIFALGSVKISLQRTQIYTEGNAKLFGILPPTLLPHSRNKEQTLTFASTDGRLPSPFNRRSQVFLWISRNSAALLLLLVPPRGSIIQRRRARPFKSTQCSEFNGLAPFQQPAAAVPLRFFSLTIDYDDNWWHLASLRHTYRFICAGFLTQSYDFNPNDTA